MRKYTRLTIFCLIFFLSSCGAEELNYLLSQAPGQLALLANRVPIEQVLKRNDLEPWVREKLELALSVKEYAEKDLELAHNKSYTVYRQLDRDAVCYNLTATPKLSLKPLSWEFPVVGRVPYLGFFKPKDALKKKGELETKGYDVYVRRVGAYSMLGIVADPLYTPMLKYDSWELANIIIHELTHGTIWAKGYPEFNENLALFIGNQGAIDFCIKKYGAGSKEVEFAIGSNQDDLLFQQYLTGLKKQLEEVYARSDLSEDEKLKIREGIFKETKTDFQENWIPKMKTDYYSGWLKLELNNAVVASRLVYYHDLSLYQAVYEKSGSDLKKMIELMSQAVKEAEKEKLNPEKYLQTWLAEN